MKMNELDIRIHEGRAQICHLNKRGNVTQSKDVTEDLLNLIVSLTVSEEGHCVFHTNEDGVFIIDTKKLTEEEIETMKKNKEKRVKQAGAVLSGMMSTYLGLGTNYAIPDYIMPKN